MEVKVFCLLLWGVTVRDRKVCANLAYLIG